MNNNLDKYTHIDMSKYMWVRRNLLEKDRNYDKGWVMSWLIPKDTIGLGSGGDAQAVLRVRGNGEIEEDNVVCLYDLIECTEDEAFSYCKPKINYQIY